MLSAEFDTDPFNGVFGEHRGRFSREFRNDPVACFLHGFNLTTSELSTFTVSPTHGYLLAADKQLVALRRPALAAGSEDAADSQEISVLMSHPCSKPLCQRALHLPLTMLRGVEEATMQGELYRLCSFPDDRAALINAELACREDLVFFLQERLSTRQQAAVAFLEGRPDASWQEINRAAGGDGVPDPRLAQMLRALGLAEDSGAQRIKLNDDGRLLASYIHAANNND